MKDQHKNIDTSSSHKLWLLCFVLFGSPMVGIVPIVVMGGLIPYLSNDNVFWMWIWVWISILYASWFGGMVPTFLIGMAIVLCDLRRGIAGSMASAAFALLGYGLYFSILNILNGSSSRTIFGLTDTVIIWGYIISGVFGTLLFSLFLPKSEAPKKIFR